MTKYLHTMIRVSDVDGTLDFFKLLGLRETHRKDSEAGRYTLPEIKLAWWNTRTNRAELAVLPARELVVSPAPGAPGDEAIETAASQAAPSATPLSGPATSAHTALTPYRIIIALLINNCNSCA